MDLNTLATLHRLIGHLEDGSECIKKLSSDRQVYDVYPGIESLKLLLDNNAEALRRAIEQARRS